MCDGENMALENNFIILFHFFLKKLQKNFLYEFWFTNTYHCKSIFIAFYSVNIEKYDIISYTQK